MSRWLVLAIVTACGHPAVQEPKPVAPPPAAAASPGPGLEQDLPRLAGRAVELYQAIAASFAKVGADCPAATAAVQQLATQYTDVISANARVLHAGRAKELRAALEPHQDALDAAGKSIADSKTMATCAPDKAFENAFDGLVGAPP